MMRLWIGLAAALALSCGENREPEPAAVALLDVGSIASAAVAERNLPGLSLVVQRGDEVLLSTGYGFADPDRSQAVSAKTVFQLGSISKQFLAALVLRLAEEGRLSLVDPVNRHLPEFAQLPPEVTVERLLSHTSGIREPFTMHEYQDGIEDLSRSAEEFVDILRGAPVDYPPGARWSYSNANYMLLALLVERLTAKPYEQVLTETLFQPFGLASLRACTPLPASPEEARGHVLRDGINQPAAPENMNWIRGDGGICGHAVDVARWTRLLASGRIVKPQSYELMIAPARLRDGRQVDYGLGLSLVTLDERRKVAHNGAMLGFSATAAYYPSDGLTVVVLTNRGDVRTESIERPISRRLLGLPAPNLQKRSLPSEERRLYAGDYDIGVFSIRIAERGEDLWLEMPSPGPTAQLRYLGNGEFAGDLDPESCRLSFNLVKSRVAEVRLFMGGMHWYGARRP